MRCGMHEISVWSTKYSLTGVFSVCAYMMTCAVATRAAVMLHQQSMHDQWHGLNCECAITTLCIVIIILLLLLLLLKTYAGYSVNRFHLKEKQFNALVWGNNINKSNGARHASAHKCSWNEVNESE